MFWCKGWSMCMCVYMQIANIIYLGQKKKKILKHMYIHSWVPYSYSTISTYRITVPFMILKAYPLSATLISICGLNDMDTFPYIIGGLMWFAICRQTLLNVCDQVFWWNVLVSASNKSRNAMSALSLLSRHLQTGNGWFMILHFPSGLWPFDCLMF